MTGNAVPVAVHGFTWTAALVGMLNILIGGALVAAIKNWPRLKELGITERRDDLDIMSERIRSLEAKVEHLTTAVHEAEMKLVSALAAYRLIASDLRNRDPDSPILAQAGELLNVSYPAPRDSGAVSGILRRSTRDAAKRKD